jgi:hypothetical protein
LAIITLSPSKSYVFIVFFRAWFGIIIFGMGNGFILLPVMLSFVGPTDDVGHVHDDLVDLPKKLTDGNEKTDFGTPTKNDR